MGPPRCFQHYDPKLWSAPTSGQEWETSFPAEWTWLKAAVLLLHPQGPGLPMGDGWVYRLAPGQNLRELFPAGPWSTLKYRRPHCHLSPKLLSLPSLWAKVEQQLLPWHPHCSPADPVQHPNTAHHMGGPGTQQAAAHLCGNTRHNSTTISHCESKEGFALILQVLGGRLSKAQSQPSTLR